jgi:putative spermidine/putrescine transport system substrate-binding protein
MNSVHQTTRSSVTRRAFLSSLGAAALAGGCRRRQRSITVFVYAGLDGIFQRHFAGPFEAATGVRVVLDAGWWDAIGKLKASPRGKPVYDLVLTDATQGYPAIRSGMFRQLDLDRIPNLQALAPVALDNWVVRDRYGVTFHESAMVLVWDRRQVAAGPTSWGDLLRPELAGQLSFYDSFYFSLFTFACMKAAADGKPGTAHRLIEENVGEVLDYAKRERGRVRSWWPTGGKMLQDLLQGNFAAGNGHSVTMLPSAKEKPDVLGFVTPEADRVYAQLKWVVPADTPNAGIAEDAVNFLLSREVQAALARSGAGTSHVEAAREVAAEDPNWARTYPSTDEQFRAMRYYPYDAYFRDWDGIRKVWEEEVLRSPK